MPLHDTEAQEIETATAAESLPDPTTVANRTHELTNTGSVTAVWSSVGATPFVEGGVNVATISVPRGESKQFQSDGVRWVAKQKGSGRAFFAGTAVSSAGGDAVFNFPAGTFAVAPVVDAAIQFPDSPNPIDFRVIALTNLSCTIRVRQSPALIILSLSVLGISVPLAGVTVHLIATSAGTTP